MADEKTIISVSSPTPQWAIWIFRVVLLLGTTLNTAIVNAPGISEKLQLSIIYWTGIVVTLVWALSRLLGIKVDPVEIGTDRGVRSADVVGGGKRPPDPPNTKP